MPTNVKKAIGFCSFLLVLFLLPGCKGEQKVCDTCLHEISAPLLHDDPTKYPIMSSMFARVDTVFLENVGVESIIPSVDEVLSFRDTIIVRSANTLFFFNSKGKFLRRFDRQGKGTGNYRTIDRFDVLPERDELYIMDGHNNRIFVYGMDGSYKRSVFIDDFVCDFAVLPDGDFLFANPIKYSGGNYRRGLWRSGPDGRFRKQLVEFDPDFAHVSINTPYINHISPGVIGFMGIEDNDKFYHYSGDSISVTCRMVTDIVIPDELKRSDKVFVNPQKEYTKCGYLETPRFLYFVNTNYGANLMIAFTDKKSWTTYRMYVLTGEFNHDKETREPFPFLVGCYNGTLVGFYDSGMILDSERFKSLFPTITADSNPVLLFFRE
ncbi:MAG: 6-bladed beta-propeller [Bacteroidaceae bacterium]|nr:6-bladed beta-propeller [Bacteroidaceae bacterium]